MAELVDAVENGSDLSWVSEAVLPVLAKELAMPVSDLVSQVLKTGGAEAEKAERENQVRMAMPDLADAGFVRRTSSGVGDDVYSITAKGLMELERTAKPTMMRKLLF